MFFSRRRHTPLHSLVSKQWADAPLTTCWDAASRFLFTVKIKTHHCSTFSILSEQVTGMFDVCILWKRHAAALKSIWCDHSISRIILPLICVSWVCSRDLSLSKVHLSWKISSSSSSSSPTSHSSPFYCSLSPWRRGNTSAATGARSYRCSGHIVS